MKITKQIIKDLEKALDTRKKDGTPIWDDGDAIDVRYGSPELTHGPINNLCPLRATSDPPSSDIRV